MERQRIKDFPGVGALGVLRAAPVLCPLPLSQSRNWVPSTRLQVCLFRKRQSVPSRCVRSFNCTIARPRPEMMGWCFNMSLCKGPLLNTGFEIKLGEKDNLLHSLSLKQARVFDEVRILYPALRRCAIELSVTQFRFDGWAWARRTLMETGLRFWERSGTTDHRP